MNFKKYSLFIVLALILQSTIAMAEVKPSFNCKKAHSPSELLICGDGELANLDNNLFRIYMQAKSLASDQKQFKAETERSWLERQHKCFDKECVKNWYQDREEYYHKFIENQKKIQELNKNKPLKLDNNSPFDQQKIITPLSTESQKSISNPSRNLEDQNKNFVNNNIFSQIGIWAIFIFTILIYLKTNKLFSSMLVASPLILIGERNLGYITTGVILIFLIIILLKIKESKDSKKKIENQVSIGRQIITIHRDELNTRRKQTTFDRGYNILDTQKWEKEKEFFVNNVIRPKLGVYFESANKAVNFSDLIENLTNNFESSKLPFNKTMTPLQYERFISDSLENFGWTAKTTVAVGDQGVDVLAVKNGIKVAIQCKLYSNPVGNDAVQQVVAGKSFYDAQFAAVVSNTDFTRSARQIAEIHRVFLIHHDDLNQLDSLIIS